MICSKLRILLVLPLLVLSGQVLCQAQRTDRRNINPQLAMTIRQVAADAAGIADADFRKLATSGSTPDPLRMESQPLSLVIVCHAVRDLPTEVQKNRSTEFRFSSTTPNPNKLVKLLQPTDAVECWTALHPKYIKDVTCDVNNGTVTGVISFDAGLYAGQVHYAASKEKKGWQINEFSFPVRDWKFIRGKDGNWKWLDHFGHIKKDRELPKQDMVGRILLDGKPIRLGRLTFIMRNYPEFSFQANSGPNRDFRVSLPVGKYTVQCTSNDLDEKYHRQSTSELIVDVEKGQSELTLKIDSTSTGRSEVASRKEAQAELLIEPLRKSLESGELHRGFSIDLQKLASIDVTEGSRAAVTEISKTILTSKFESKRDTNTLHHKAIDVLLAWGTAEDQNSLFCDFLSSKFRNLDGRQDEKVYRVLVDSGSERGIELVIRRLRKYNHGANPAAKVLMDGGSKCEELLISVAQSTKTIGKKIVPILEKIGSEKCVPFLERLELDCEDEYERNKIHETRVKILERLEKLSSK